jgi:hypothetical protein
MVSKGRNGNAERVAELSLVKRCNSTARVKTVSKYKPLRYRAHTTSAIFSNMAKLPLQVGQLTTGTTSRKPNQWLTPGADSHIPEVHPTHIADIYLRNSAQKH